MKDPRSHRRYRDAAKRWITSMGGQHVPCCICGQPCDTSLPGTHAWGPTVEHQPPVRHIVAVARDYRDAVTMVANPAHWAGIAHRRCQAQQGQQATATLNRARNNARANTQLDGASRVW